jgi:MATE family multidrug resistance protein
MLLRRRERHEFGFWRHGAFDRELFGRLIRYGLPNGFQYFAEISGFTLFIFLIGRIGKDELAATSLAFNLNSLAFIPMLGFGIAVTTLVGKRIGERRPDLAVRTTWIAFGLTAVYMLTFAAAYVLLPDLLLKLYTRYGSTTDFAPIRDLVYMLLRFVALYSFFDGMAIVFGSAVRGAGDTRFSMIFTAIAGWTLMVMPTAIAFWLYGGNLAVGWTACSIYVAVMGLGFLYRFQTGKWKSMRVIEEHMDAPAGAIDPSHLPVGKTAKATE